MTDVLENPALDTDTDAPEGETAEEKSAREKDFSKFTKKHQEIADYVNENSGLEAITPNQVKAVLLLRTEFSNTPEVKAAREARKAELAAEKERFAGLSPEQIKAEKAALRADKQAEKMAEKLAEAQAKAQKLRDAAAAGGEDLAALVEAEQNKPKPTTKRKPTVAK